MTQTDHEWNFPDELDASHFIEASIDSEAYGRLAQVAERLPGLQTRRLVEEGMESVDYDDDNYVTVGANLSTEITASGQTHRESMIHLEVRENGESEHAGSETDDI